MSGIDEYGIQSIPPRYDEHNSYYVHTSEGYSRAVEEIEAEEREIAEAELRDETQKRLESEEMIRLEEYNRENEKRILEEIRLREEQRELQISDLDEYNPEETPPPGTNLDLLA